MPAKLRALRGEPLLTPPKDDESRWLELSPSQVDGMRRALRVTSSDPERIQQFASQAYAMSMLGFDVSLQARRKGVELAAALKKLAEDESEHGKISPYASKMRALGLEADVGAYDYEIRGALGAAHSNSDWKGFFAQAAAMKRLGYDVGMYVEGRAVEAKATLHGLAREGEWHDFASHAVNIREVGVECEKEVKENAPDLVDALRLERSYSWVVMTQHAANLAELGLLTPAEKAAGANAMPPLKKFRRRL